jgi:hypothetical protein
MEMDHPGDLTPYNLRTQHAAIRGYNFYQRQEPCFSNFMPLVEYVYLDGAISQGVQGTFSQPVDIVDSLLVSQAAPGYNGWLSRWDEIAVCGQARPQQGALGLPQERPLQPRPKTSIQSNREQAELPPPCIKSVKPISSTRDKSGCSTQSPSMTLSMSRRRQ